MSKKIIISAVIVLAVLIIGVGVYYFIGKTEKPIACSEEAKICWDGSSVGRTGSNCEFASCPEEPNSKNDLIRVSLPAVNQVVGSPLSIEGEARGTWYFEASFPIKIVDANGKVLGSAIAQAQSDWMTEDFVPFKAQLSFSVPSTETGILIFKKDNPSGLPEHDDELQIPIRFDLSFAPQRVVRLYYYNSSKDEDISGNIMCSRNGLEPVERTIPLTQTPIQDAIKLLLKGELTAQERARGIATEYPLSGVELKSASLNGGVLTLAFVDPQNKTGGGSCRVGILWFQIEATAKQFPEVSSVRFLPEELFQP
jgi:hypothetical protein